MFMLFLTVDGDLRQLAEIVRDLRSGCGRIATRLLRSLAPDGWSLSGRADVAQPAWSEDELDALLGVEGWKR